MNRELLIENVISIALVRTLDGNVMTRQVPFLIDVELNASGGIANGPKIYIIIFFANVQLLCVNKNIAVFIMK